VTELFPLVVKQAVVRRQGKTLVGPIDLEWSGQGVTIVIGPNGSGKTTLLRMLHGIVRLRSGSLDWACPTSEAQKRQAFVFQTPVMLRRSVRDNLIFPLSLIKTPRPKAAEMAETWARKVGLGEALNRQANVLSGGERQKLALARALIRDPDVLFLDEPCASLDGRATRDIEVILQEAAAAGTRLIMATHDMGQARRLADDVAFILAGKIHEFGSAQEFFEGPQTAQASAFLRGDIVL
jgi:tungstate transport system ATP-binding protein